MMSPMTRNIAIAAAALAVPAAIAAAAGPDRMRRLPSQMRDLWPDDSVEGQLKQLTARLNGLTDDLHIHSTQNETLAHVGRVAAIVGAVLLVPAALAAWFGPRRIRDAVVDYAEDWQSQGTGADGSPFDDLSDDLHDLEDDIEEQRDDAYASVTGAAKQFRD